MVEDFLANHGWGNAKISPLAGDASFRRYMRVSHDQNGGAMLMFAPPPEEDVGPFLNMTDYLIENGFRAPKIFARDTEIGFILLEDFGDIRIKEYLEQDGDAINEEATYQKAVDTLLGLAEAPPANVPVYDKAAYMREIMLFSSWYMPAMNIINGIDELHVIWENLLTPIISAQSSPVTVLRDYHAENIMIVDEGDFGLIDYQDALLGHRAYDLLSLLQDARRDVPEELEQKMLQYYIDKANISDEFKDHYAILAAQRNIKIIGIFTRLWQRDGKAHYLEFLPRMWRLLERDLAQPALKDVRAWFDKYIPHSVRNISAQDMIKGAS
ncbi:hypothetical protein LPB140_08165 [Sphingorhabdus lutea]|uniref:Aminoglycoside phosphotransferase domain-containing protein n=1 Tax=Sphingorhabdus lutea TaxID=1913578 RepID=A0A1L3JF06_9SPHN|nr:phosphotransferase [Sphingorhabdus lutea]APG63712.1 hypothetical protein LPB140_08165 [Sphingorhabdus lutea]